MNFNVKQIPILLLLWLVTSVIWKVDEPSRRRYILIDDEIERYTDENFIGSTRIC